MLIVPHDSRAGRLDDLLFWLSLPSTGAGAGGRVPAFMAEIGTFEILHEDAGSQARLGRLWTAQFMPLKMRLFLRTSLLPGRMLSST